MVRFGGDFYHPPHPETGAQQHTMSTVYRDMLLQICMDYPALPDPRTLTNTEIRFFYNGLRKTLERHSAPKP